MNNNQDSYPGRRIARGERTECVSESCGRLISVRSRLKSGLCGTCYRRSQELKKTKEINLLSSWLYLNHHSVLEEYNKYMRDSQ